jgi:hypothetical protein
MGTARGVTLLALVLALAGCGQTESQPRAQVKAYLVAVNRVETAMTKPLTAVTQAGNQFAAERAAGTTVASDYLLRAHETALLNAGRRIRALSAQLAAIPVPSSAIHLRAMLLQLAAAQARLSDQSASLVAFLPAFDAALRPIVPATRRLVAVLAVNRANGSAAVQSVLAGKAAALRAFRTTLEATLAGLRRLDPPDVSVPNFRAQVTAIAGMSGAAGKLADALATSDSAAIPPLLIAFDRAETGPQTRATAQAERTAVLAYNRELAGLNGLATQAQRERLRLQNTLQ